MRQLKADDLESLCLGSAILGSGGGGDPAYSLLMARHLIETYGPVNILSVAELCNEDLVVPLSLMGAPLITMERLLSGKELESLLQTIEKNLNQKPTVLMAAEIGGANAFTPLLIAAKWGLPVLDADLIGRAFPQLQMNSCYLKNLKATPAVVADCLGNVVIIEALNAQALEKMARALTVSMGSSSAVAFHLMQGKEVPGAVVDGSLSKALLWGKVIEQARNEGRDPIQAFLAKSRGIVLGRGSLIEIDQSIKEGFLQGSVSLLNGEELITLFYQNEYLLAKRGDKILASTPDLLVLLEENSGTPISSEGLRYGLRAVLLKIEAPEIWNTQEGLALVGPKVFGYEVV